MKDLQIFSSEEFGQIRTIEMNGKPLFCGSDVAKALGYAIPSKAVNQHCKGVSKMEVPTNGGMQQMLFIPEGDLYRLIVNSKLPTAEKFELWVFDEVLPSIRKNGFYENKNISTEMKAILMHDEKIVGIENRMDKLEYDIPLYGAESDELSNHVKRKGVEMLGGKKSGAYNDKEIRFKLYRDLYAQIKREFGLFYPDGRAMSYKALKRKYIADAHELVDDYELPAYLEEMIQDANSIQYLKQQKVG